jgi:hypothetical protein
MDRNSITDAAVGAVGSAAGAVVDPAQGLRVLRSARSTRLLAVAAAGLAVGYLVGRRRRR